MREMSDNFFKYLNMSYKIYIKKRLGQGKYKQKQAN